MNYNPYAAPQAAPPPQQGPQNYGGGPQPWDVGEVFSLAFEGFKRCWPILFGTYFLTAIVAGLPGQIPSILVAVRVIDANSGVYWGMYSVFMLIGICLQALFQGGLIRSGSPLRAEERPSSAIFSPTWVSSCRWWRRSS